MVSFQKLALVSFVKRGQDLSNYVFNMFQMAEKSNDMKDRLHSCSQCFSLWESSRIANFSHQWGNSFNLHEPSKLI